MLKQQGASTMGILSTIVLVGALLTLAVRIGPLYWDNMSLNQAIKSAARNGDFDRLAKSEIHDRLSKSFQVNNISVNPRHFDITQTNNYTELSYVHEERVNIVGNLDVVVTFTNRYSTAD